MGAKATRPLMSGTVMGSGTVGPPVITPLVLNAMKKQSTDSRTRMTQPVKVNAEVMRSLFEGVVSCYMTVVASG